MLGNDMNISVANTGVGAVHTAACQRQSRRYRLLPSAVDPALRVSGASTNCSKPRSCAWKIRAISSPVGVTMASCRGLELTTSNRGYARPARQSRCTDIRPVRSPHNKVFRAGCNADGVLTVAA